MAITYRYEPSAQAVGAAAFQGGLGQRLERERVRQIQAQQFQAQLQQRQALANQNVQARQQEALFNRKVNIEQLGLRARMGDRDRIADAKIVEERDFRMKGIYAEKAQQLAIEQERQIELRAEMNRRAELDKKYPIGPKGVEIQRYYDEQLAGLRKERDDMPPEAYEQFEAEINEQLENEDIDQYREKADPWPDGQGVGESWTNPITGQIKTRDHNGNEKDIGIDLAIAAENFEKRVTRDKDGNATGSYLDDKGNEIERPQFKIRREAEESRQEKIDELTEKYYDEERDVWTEAREGKKPPIFTWQQARVKAQQAIGGGEGQGDGLGGALGGVGAAIEGLGAIADSPVVVPPQEAQAAPQRDVTRLSDEEIKAVRYSDTLRERNPDKFAEWNRNDMKALLSIEEKHPDIRGWTFGEPDKQGFLKNYPNYLKRARDEEKKPFLAPAKSENEFASITSRLDELRGRNPSDDFNQWDPEDAKEYLELVDRNSKQGK